MYFYYKRCLSLIFSILFIYLLIPFNGVAMPVLDDEITTEPMVYEVIELREEYVKHFALPDGTYQAVTYSEAVHELDEDGHWQEIDNRLHLVNTKGIELFSNNSARTLFAKNFSPNQTLFSINDDQYAISMSVIQNSLDTELMGLTPECFEANITNAKIRNSNSFANIDEAAVFDNSSSIIYTDALPGVDLEYILKGRSVKENIIVKSKSTSYSYDFGLELRGLSARQEIDGSISIFDSHDDIKYTIPTGLMYDATGEASVDVTYKLSVSSNMAYLTIIADENWINSPDRVFPVVIDPTLKYGDNLYDTYVNSAAPSTPHGSESALWLTQTGSDKGISNVLIRCNLPTLPLGANLTGARLSIYYYYLSNITTGYLGFNVYRVNKYWTEDSATHNYLGNSYYDPTSIFKGYTYAWLGATVIEPYEVDINILPAAKEWYSGKSNCGVVLKYCEGDKLSVIIRSTEAVTQYIPQFRFTYDVERLDDGIYTLENAASPMLCHVNDNALGQIYTNQTTINEQFKFTWLGDVNGESIYSIRSMINSELGVSASTSGGIATISNIGITDSLAAIDTSAKWAVIYSDGRYYIRNGSSAAGSYLSSPGDTTSASVIVSDVNSSYLSKWILTPQTNVDNSAHFTQSQNTVKLGSTAQFTAVVRSSQPGQNGPVIYTVVNEDGNATNIATINENGVFTAINYGVVKVNATFLGADQPTSLTVYIADYEKDIQIHYDEGYLTRFPNAQSRIAGQVEVLKNYYLTEFGLRINCNIIGVYKSPADLCATSNIDTSCTCFGNTTCANGKYIQTGLNESEMDYIPSVHHKNLYNILYDQQPSSGYDAIISYTGHKCCNYSNIIGHNNDGDLKGLADIDHSVACINAWQVSETQETFTLVHEFGHLIGAPDHYGDYSKDHQDGEDDCIYGENRNNYRDGNDYVICPYCKGIIEGILQP